MPPVFSTMRYIVEVKEGRPTRCRITEVTHEKTHSVIEFDTSKDPPVYEQVGLLEDTFASNPAISMVPVTSFGWIDILENTRCACSEDVSASARGLCLFLARVDTTRPWSEQKPESKMRTSKICKFTELLVKVAKGAPGNYPPCIDEDGLKWLRGKGLTRDADYKSSSSASSSLQGNTLQHVAECCVCLELSLIHI